MQSKFRALKYALLASLAASGMAAAQTPPTTDQAGTAPNAQNADPNAPPTESPVAGGPKKSATEEIVVTGSRIRRKDLNTPAPVTVVTRDQIQASGKVSVGDFLQTLPEQGNTVNAQVNNGNDGSVRVALRSLGSARTLVLVNGRRMVPGGTGADSSADLSTIPSAAIERVEVLKDGASAIYGSDAIAGVVNVILRKRYSGTEVGGYAGVTQRGDGNTYDIHGITGTSGDKGSILFSVGYQDQHQIFAGDRGWSSTTYGYDFDTGEKTPSGNSSTWPQGRFALPDPANNCAAVNNPTPQTAQICGLSTKQGQTFEPSPAKGGASSWIKYPGVPYNTNPTNYLITPARRIQLFSTGDVNVGSEARAFFEASYVNRTSSQDLAPMPIVSTTIPTNPVSISKDSLYNPFGVDIATWRRRSVEFGNRHFAQDLDTFRVVVGLDGALGEWAGPASGWTWGLDYNHGRTAGNERDTGQVSMSRLANALGPSMRDASGNPICVRVAGQASTKIGNCVPYDVLHGVNSLSQAQFDAVKNYVAFDGQNFGHNQQDIWSLNFSGDLFRLMANRPAGLAVGGDYRRESASNLPNPITASLDSSGNNLLPTSGSYKVWEAYGELVLPVISNMPFVEDLELVGAVRYNNFNTFGDYTTYKLGARWSPIRDITFRGTYGTAYRAPNIGELYGGAADDYPAVKDPCNNPAGRVAVRCAANGPGGNIPGGNSRDPSTQFLSKHLASANLSAETAKVATFGVVIQPQMLRGLSLTVDWYNISVENTITLRGAQFILDQCYRADTQNAAMCNLILRSANGQIIQINDERANVGNYHTAGIDFAVRYDLPLENYGRFNFNIDGTLLRSFRITDELGVVTDGYDNYDTVGLPVGGALPKLKVNAGVFWSFGPFGAGVIGRYIGSYTECGDADGNTGGVCSQDRSHQHRVSYYLPVDLFASYTLRNWTAGTTQLVLGIQNVADTNPPYIANAFAANSDPSTYDYLGRFFYTRLTHNF